MKAPVVSIIVPMYNVEKYLPKCLDSILNQTLKDIEVIAIDDGSTDSSSKILDEYAEKDSRIIALHIKNHGVSHARNLGLKKAIGKYIGFVDSDDFIDCCMYERLVEVAERTEADCVQCEFETVYDSGKVEVSGEFGNEEIYEKLDAVSALMGFRISYSVWSKIFRRDSIGGLRFFEEWHFAEDFRFISEFFKQCIKVCTIPDVLYHYFAWSGSLAHKGIDESNLVSLEVYDYLEGLVKDSAPHMKDVLEREIKESLTFFNAAIGHANIRRELIRTTAKRIHRSRAGIKGNRYFTTAEKLMAWLICFCPKPYIFVVTCVKRIKGIK